VTSHELSCQQAIRLQLALDEPPLIHFEGDLIAKEAQMERAPTPQMIAGSNGKTIFIISS